MATIRLADGSEPPFGAVVTSADNRELGIVNDGGQVYLSGINSGDILTLRRGSEAACRMTVPELAPGQALYTLADLRRRAAIRPGKTAAGCAAVFPAAG